MKKALVLVVVFFSLGGVAEAKWLHMDKARKAAHKFEDRDMRNLNGKDLRRGSMQRVGPHSVRFHYGFTSQGWTDSDGEKYDVAMSLTAYVRLTPRGGVAVRIP